MTEHALIAAGWWLLVPVVLVPAALTGGAVLRFAARAFFGLGVPASADSRDDQEEDPETPSPLPRAPMAMLVPMVALVLLPTATAGYDVWSWSSVLLGVLGGALTVLVAAAGLRSARVNVPRALLVVHRSHIGDYVAWTLVGVVLLAVLVAV